MLDKEDIDFLSDTEEQEFLNACIELIHSPVKIVEKLKSRYQENQINKFAELLECRYHARQKFSKSSEMFFAKEGLEQATSEPVSLFKSAHYFKDCACVDLCCGIGGTTLGLARDAVSVTAVDISALHLKMAEYNVRLYIPENRCVFAEGDVTKDIPEGDACHFDPSRREGMQRAFDPEEYIPPLSCVDEIRKINQNVIVKVSPLFDIKDSEEYSVDIISYRGEVKEILLCYGKFRKDEIRAIILPGEIILQHDPKAEEQTGSDVKKFIYDPDPAAVKGGLINTLAQELNLSVIAPDIRYMTSDKHVQSPLVKGFEVQEVFPFSYRHVNRYFKKHSIGNISVKCKDSFIKTGSITKKLQPKGKGTAALFYIDRGDNDRIFVVAKQIKM